MKTFTITFNTHAKAAAVVVQKKEELNEAIRQLDILASRPVLVLVGGANGLDSQRLLSLWPFFVGALCPFIEKEGLTVVDGGTDAGIMQLIGRARTKIRANFALVGVVASGTVRLPGRILFWPGLRRARLEPNHTHFIVVPGAHWGDESPWLSHVASCLAADQPSVTVLINGGEISWKDVFCSVQAGRLVIVAAGTGRAADQLAGILRGEMTDDHTLGLAESGLLQAVDLSGTSEPFISSIKQVLSTRRLDGEQGELSRLA